MKLKTYKNIKYFQSDLLNSHKFKHAFFTKRSQNNEPTSLQNKLDLTSSIHYLKHHLYFVKEIMMNLKLQYLYLYYIMLNQKRVRFIFKINMKEMKWLLILA